GGDRQRHGRHHPGRSPVPTRPSRCNGRGVRSRYMRSRAAFAAVVLLLAGGCSRPPPDPYAAYRQTVAEKVPGTLDWQLEPIQEGDFRAQVAPAKLTKEV